MRAARIIRDAAGVVTWVLLWVLRFVWAPYLLLRIDALDWLLVILVVMTDRWESVVLFLIQFAARRTPFLARSLVSLAGLPEDAEWVGWVLPALRIMSHSGSEGPGTSSEPPEPELVPRLPDAAGTGICTSNEIALSRHMTRQELIAILAVQEADGQPVFSSNKIVTLFEKTALTASRSVMLDEIDLIRNGPPQSAAHGGRLERPQGGW